MKNRQKRLHSPVSMLWPTKGSNSHSIDCYYVSLFHHKVSSFYSSFLLQANLRFCSLLFVDFSMAKANTFGKMRSWRRRRKRKKKGNNRGSFSSSYFQIAKLIATIPSLIPSAFHPHYVSFSSSSSSSYSDRKGRNLLYHHTFLAENNSLHFKVFFFSTLDFITWIVHRMMMIDNTKKNRFYSVMSLIQILLNG